MQNITFIGSVNSTYARKLGSKDKKKRVINNKPSADGQAPMNEIGQQRTGYKYYRKRRAAGFIGVTGGLGAISGATIGGTVGAVMGKPKTGAAIGAGIGAAGLGGASLVEHMSNKHSPFYQKKLFKKKEKTMTRLKIINKTPLKSRAIPYIELSARYFHWLEKDVEIVVDIIREKDNHLEVTLLTTNLKDLPVGIRSWYIYKEHVEVFDEPGTKKVKGKNILKTDYYYQLHNNYQPYTSCFLSCVAMLLSFYKIKVTPDELYEKCQSLGYNRFDHQHISEIINSYGVNYYPTTKGTFEQIKEALETAPVIIGTFLTEGSHIVILIGYDDSAYDGQGAFIVRDPYGEFTHKGYIHTPTAGNGTLYSYGLMAEVAAPEGDGNYWLHLLT